MIKSYSLVEGTLYEVVRLQVWSHEIIDSAASCGGLGWVGVVGVLPSNRPQEGTLSMHARLQLVETQ